MRFYKIVSDEMINTNTPYYFDMNGKGLLMMNFTTLEHVLKDIDKGNVLCQVIPDKNCEVYIDEDNSRYYCKKGKLINPHKITNDVIYEMIQHGADVHTGDDLPLVKSVEMGDYNLFSFFQNTCGANVTVHDNFCLQVCYQNLLKNKNLGNIDLLNMTLDILRWTNKKTNQFVEHLSFLIKAKKIDAIETREVIINYCKDELQLSFVAGALPWGETINPIYENIDDVNDKVVEDYKDDLEPHYHTNFQEEVTMEDYYY